jgi:hypothetical protein
VLEAQGAMQCWRPRDRVYRGADAVLAGIDRDGSYVATVVFARTAEFEAGGFTGGVDLRAEWVSNGLQSSLFPVLAAVCATPVSPDRTLP